MRSAWEVLGIEPGASEEEIRAAFRRRAQELHPDKGGDRDAWDELQSAYVMAMTMAGQGTAETVDTSPRRRWASLPRWTRATVIGVGGGLGNVAFATYFIGGAVAEDIPWVIPATLCAYPVTWWLWLLYRELRRPALRPFRWVTVRIPEDPAERERLLQEMELRERERR